MKRCFQLPASAYVTAQRDYTLVKLAIYKLREFHDAFVKQGGIPIKVIWRLMLAKDTSGVF